jgi:hypothetical protein
MAGNTFLQFPERLKFTKKNLGLYLTLSFGQNYFEITLKWLTTRKSDFFANAINQV